MTFKDEQMDARYHTYKAEYHIAMARMKIKDVTPEMADRLFGAVALMTKELKENEVR